MVALTAVWWLATSGGLLLHSIRRGIQYFVQSEHQGICKQQADTPTHVIYGAAAQAGQALKRARIGSAAWSMGALTAMLTLLLVFYCTRNTTEDFCVLLSSTNRACPPNRVELKRQRSSLALDDDNQGRRFRLKGMTKTQAISYVREHYSKLVDQGRPNTSSALIVNA